MFDGCVWCSHLSEEQRLPSVTLLFESVDILAQLLDLLLDLLHCVQLVFDGNHVRFDNSDFIVARLHGFCELLQLRADL